MGTTKTRQRDESLPELALAIKTLAYHPLRVLHRRDHRETIAHHLVPQCC